MSELIAIVGRPNVGKSALFNRLVGKRIAIVHNQPGVTRDRVIAQSEWLGRAFSVVDTGGIGLGFGEKTKDEILQAALEQAVLAIDSAAVIILVVDVREGIVPLDQEVAERLRRSRKPVLVAANKADTDRSAAGATEFVALGFEKIFPVSAIHGEGIGPLMEAAMALLPPVESAPETALATASAALTDSETGRSAPPAPLKLAIVGRPNVGKSSIINALTQSERVIVNPTPGTTRDAVDVPFEIKTDGTRQRFVLIDTAGLRKQRRVDDSIEFYSVKRTEEAIARCDIAIFVLDAVDGIIEQDKKVADKIVNERRACIVVVNKWDLVSKNVAEARKEKMLRRNLGERPRGSEKKPMAAFAEFAEWVQERLFFLDYAPVFFTSALSGLHLDRLLKAVRYVAAQLQQKIPTAILNRTLADAIEQRQPVSAAGHRLKMFYATQVRQAPPTFLLFVNRQELFSKAYEKYLTGQMRRAFGYEGCPIIIVAKARPKTIQPIRQIKRRARPRIDQRAHRSFNSQAEAGKTRRGQRRSVAGA